MNTFKTYSGAITSLMLCAGLLTLPAAHAEQTGQEQSKAKTAKSTSKTLGGEKAKKGGAIKHKGQLPKSDAVTKPSDKTLVDPSNKANSHHDVWFHSVDIDLYQDPNHNGYYNQLVVDFDADTAFNHIDVYAVMSLTDPNGITESYYVTDNFGLYGESTNDTRQVDTVLTANWLTDGYDLSISLYDAYSQELVAHVDKYEAPQMGYLTLESLEYEFSAEQHLSVYSSSLWLNTDTDHDGYYHEFNIDMDIDVTWGSKDVYAEIYISNDNFYWEPLYTSDHFIVYEDDTSDTRHWEFELLGGKPTGRYYIKVLLVDANSHQTLMEVLPEHHAALYDIPLEDFSFEIPPVVVDNHRDSVSHESGGGSMGGPLSILAMMMLAFVRRRHCKQS